jgi:hypothetical protein
MKPSQVRDHFSQAERSLSHAALACEANDGVAPVTRRRLAEWQRECEHMRAALDSGYDIDQLRARVDALEQAVHRLVERCRRRAVDDEVEIAVEHAHAVLADLKLKLH